MKLICKDEDLRNGRKAVVELYDSEGVLALWIEAEVDKKTGGIGFKQIYAENQVPKLLTNPDSVVI